MHLLNPSADLLPDYVQALEQGWSPDNVHGASAIKEQLEKIAKDPVAFISSLTDLKAIGEAISLPDGTKVQRLPSYQQWLWDGEFCGAIGFRWQPGSNALPPHCLGHIGYSVVPWKQGNGYATEALKQLLSKIKTEEFQYVEIVTDPDNIPSQRVIEKNGGKLIERFEKPKHYGQSSSLRYRILLVEQ